MSITLKPINSNQFKTPKALNKPLSTLKSILNRPNPNKDISDILEHQSRFPAIATLARDTLSFPATNARVKQLFNTAQDICHYRRKRIKSETIEDLMMFLYTSRFNIEEQKKDLLKQFFSHSKIEATKEKKDEKLNSVEFLTISDTKEQN
ncbi:unnamed protein product [Penicillium salamii]|nr:unnamed protein product [Penicillium salamii]